MPGREGQERMVRGHKAVDKRVFVCVESFNARLSYLKMKPFMEVEEEEVY